MRSISADQEAILSGGARKMSVRFSVKDAWGTYHDLTTYGGVNLLKSLTWHEGVDDPGITWEATFVREQELLSLSPEMQTSGFNRLFNIAVPFSRLLQIGRQVLVEWALQAEDDPQAPTWVTAFEGLLDTVSWPGDELSCTGRGAEAPLIDNYIERERIYALAQGANATKGCYIWPQNSDGWIRTFAVNDLILPAGGKYNGHFYKATSITTGIVGATEPVWPTGSGATVVDGGVTWTEAGATSDSTGTAVETIIQQLLNDNGTGVTIWCPTSPAWEVKWFEVSRQPLFTELRLLADQIGWCIRYVWDPGTSAMRLKLYDPLRSNTTSARSFGKSETEIKRAQIQIFDVRNVVPVVYADSQDLDTAGYPKRKIVTVFDSASITKYGRRFCEIAEASSSNIDTPTEATALANAVLSDLKDPQADFEALVSLFPFVELTDLYTLAANGVHFDVDEKLAVVGYDHVHSATDSTTTIRLRGTPSSGASTWLQRSTDAYDGDVHAFQTVDSSRTFVALQVGAPVGGASGSIVWGGGKAARDVQFEWHISETNAFVHDATTLKCVTSERSFNFGDLDPAKVYYGKVVPLAFNGRRRVQGLPSEQFTITPGRGQATHLNPNVQWGRLPLNGGFETQFDTSSPPDFWFVNSAYAGAGGWGTSAFLLSDGNGLQGNNYLQLKTTSLLAANLFSAEFSVNELRVAVLKFWRKAVAGGAVNAKVGVWWYDYTRAYLDVDEETFLLNDQVGDWVEHVSAAVTPPAGARFARMYVAIDSGGTREAHFDSVEFVPAEPVSTTVETITFTQSDPFPGPYTSPTLALASAPKGVRLVRTECITTPGEPVYSAVDVSQWAFSAGTLSWFAIPGLTIGVQYRLTLEISYA